MISVDGAIEAGTVLVGKYRIESVIGRGGMGLVYRAHHLTLGESVAIKVLRRDVSRDDEVVARFVREAQSAVQLKSEHVARIRDVGTLDDGLPYIVMEYLEGADLGQLVDTNGAMHVPVAVDLLLQASDAIAEAHSLGIVHRDIKPSNLFVSFRPDETAIVKVLDFGISKSSSGADLSLTQTSSMLGTPAYMSPEQMRSARDVDARTDVWSLGTVLYELVEGRRPFEAESFSEMCVMVAVDAPTPMVLARELESIIMKCLAKKADDRYANVAALMQDLALYAGNADAARHFTTRAHRVLGLRQNPDSSPSLRPAVTYQTPVPSMHLSALMGSPAPPAQTAVRSAIAAPTLATTIPARSSNRTLAVILVLCVLAGVGGVIGYVKATESDHIATVATTAHATDDEGATGRGGRAGSAPTASTGSNAGSDAAGSGLAGSGSAVAAGSGAASGSADAAGSGAASGSADAAGSAAAGSGSGTSSGSATVASVGTRTRAGSATVASAGGKTGKRSGRTGKGGGGKTGKGGGKAGTGGGKTGKGGGVDAGKGAGSATTVPGKPKCDPFASIRSGC